MTDTGRDTLDMRDEDRLPWLEAVDDEEAVEGPSSLKLILGVVIALVAIGIVVGGIFWLKNRVEAPQGDASVIPAPASPYKVKPAEPGGMQVEGSGDTAYAASQGADQNSAIDLSAMPETAVTADHSQPAIPAKPQPAPASAAPARPPAPAAAPKPAPKPAEIATAKLPAAATRPAPAASKPAPAASAPPAPASTAPVTGGTIQLGAFSSEAKANAAWKSLSKRYAYLGALTPAVTPVSANGATLYRLRAPAGGQASTICAKLKVAGETCAVIG